MVYVVTGAMAVVPGPGGKLAHLYSGAVLPDQVPARIVDHLVECGLVSEADPIPTLVVGTVATEPVVVLEPEHDTGEGDRPPRVAAKALWIEYAVTQGVPEGEAVEMTKDALVERFATQG